MTRAAPAMVAALMVATHRLLVAWRRHVGTEAAREPAGEAAASPAPAPAPVYDDLEPAASDDRADAGTVKIKLLADARRQAHVFWGRKDLGVAPVEIVRPRGSAPMDLTIQAPDCLPLHTRVFTDRDDTLSLRLYTEREAAGLPGYSPTATKGPPRRRRKAPLPLPKRGASFETTVEYSMKSLFSFQLRRVSPTMPGIFTRITHTSEKGEHAHGQADV